jgi:NADH-quinone oxidoreductase subunit L
MKAFLVNRVGDFGFALGVFLLWTTFSTLNFHDTAEGSGILGQTMLSAAEPYAGVSPGVMTAICLLLFLGACGKSAQFPLHVWLPDAMEGPTPVSALIHAATMVTAGVYMVARLNFLFSLSAVAMTVVASVGALTAIFAATIGFFQTDIKKVLAYSTVSQLGYMFLGVGVGAYAAGIFHLMTHAFFKACLFLGSGAVIASMHHRQDMKDMGGLAKHIPWTYRTFFISTLAIAGVPGLAGFFSKDEILWKAFDNGNTLIPGWILWLVGATAAGCTAFYMFRLTWQIFSGEYRGAGDEHAHADAHAAEAAHGHDADHGHGHDAHAADEDAHGHHGGGMPAPEDWRMTLPLVILAFLAIVGGYVGVPAALGGNDGFHHFLAPVMAVAEPRLHWLSAANDGHGSGLHSHTGEYVLMLASVLVALGGIALATRIYRNRYRSPEEEQAMYGAKLWRVLYNKYFVDEGYFRFIIHPFVALCRFLARFDGKVIDGAVNLAGFLLKLVAWTSGAIDKYFVDGAVNGIAAVIGWSGGRVRRIQTGRIQNYVLGAMAGCIAVILLVIILK